MKLIVETTGEFMLIAGNGTIVPHDRPAVLPADGWVQQQVAIGQLRVLPHQLADAASDAEFAEWLAASDGDKELAVVSYAEAHPLNPLPAEPPA